MRYPQFLSLLGFVLTLSPSLLIAVPGDSPHPTCVEIVADLTSETGPEVLPVTFPVGKCSLRIHQISFMPDGRAGLIRMENIHKAAFLFSRDFSLDQPEFGTQLLPADTFFPGTSLNWMAFHGDSLVSVSSDLTHLFVQIVDSKMPRARTIELPGNSWIVSHVGVSDNLRYLAASNTSVWTPRANAGVATFLEALPENLRQDPDLAHISGGAPRHPGPPFLYDLHSESAVPLEPQAMIEPLHDEILFSPDGRYLVAIKGGSQERPPTFTLVVWETATGNAISVQSFRTKIQNLTFTPDGHFLLAGDLHTPTIRIWDATQRFQLVRAVTLSPPSDAFYQWGGISSPTIFPDGKSVVAIHNYPSNLFSQDGQFNLPGRDRLPQGIPQLENRLITWTLESLLHDMPPLSQRNVPFVPGLLGATQFSPQGDRLFVGLTEERQLGVIRNPRASDP